MDALDLPYLSAVTMAAMIRRREISPVEVAEMVAVRIDEHEPRLSAFATVALEQAIEQARAAERQIARGEPLGPLHGVPVTVKDLIHTCDLATQFGSVTRRDHQPAADAPSVSRLKQAGAIIMGKTTTTEFGWAATSVSPLTGVTRNPWRDDRTAGGSSSGAAVAAAAGFGPLHLGSDGAGSIRLPAHFCGVMGLKPTYGRVAQYPVSVGDNATQLGPIARTAADCALMLDVISGVNSRDHTSLPRPAASFLRALDGAPVVRRLAFSPDLGHARVDPEVAAIVRRGATRLASRIGAELVEVTPAWGVDGPDLVRFFWSAHLAGFEPLLPKWGEQMDSGLVACIRSGVRHSMTEYQVNRERKYAYCAQVNTFLEQWYYLLTPAASVAAFPVDLLQPPGWPVHPWDWLSWAEFSYPINLAGCTAASVPCGNTADGLPVGLQIVGQRFDEAGVLNLCQHVEADIDVATRYWGPSKLGEPVLVLLGTLTAETSQ
jgi:aspartyl-tRNA(Asn)/glutamyl-tRNA(Gln) amidotransferase subunit A